MDANPDVFTDSNAEGIERVQESGGKYAFFMESASIEYIMERHCELARVGRELDAKGYGIGDETFCHSVEITTIHLICCNVSHGGCPKRHGGCPKRHNHNNSETLFEHKTLDN